MKNKVLFTLCIFAMISILSSCSLLDKNKRYFNNLISENEIEDLSYDNLEYFYHYTSGFEDKVGLNYYYFSFGEYPKEFIKQFDSKSSKFYFEKSTEFELEIVSKIDRYIGKKYDEIDGKFKLDFNISYYYSNFPMILNVETNDLVLIEFIFVR